LKDLAEKSSTLKKINLAISGIRFAKRLMKYDYYLENEQAVLIELKMAAVLIERVISSIEYSKLKNRDEEDQNGSCL